MECIDFFLPPQQPSASPVADDVDGLPHADSQGHEHGADRHGKDDQCHRAQLELSRGTGMDRDRAGIQFAEIAIEEDAGADEENRGEQSEHDLRSFRRIRPRSRGRLRSQHRRRLLAGNRHALGVGPQPFESVMLTDILPEDMDDNVPEVHQHPL